MRTFMRHLLAAGLLMLGTSSCSQIPDMPNSNVRTVHSQPSWIARNDTVELAVTQLGAHMAPVSFYRNAGPVQPYYISPWQDENLKLDAPVLVPLRGDFFCMPFGGNADAIDGEKFPPHGETAGSKWSSVGLTKSGNVTTLALALKINIRPGTVTRKFMLVDGQNVVYTQETLDGFSGKMSLGHHASLALPDKDGAVRIATSPFQFGMTYPGVFSDPAKREYQCFANGQRFTDLTKVPLMWKDPTEADCTAFPNRTGYEDLLALFSQPADKLDGPAWTTATNQDAGYLWFSLKDPAKQPATVFWIDNKGRHESPWNGRSRCLGLEDVCGFFADGVAASVRPNLLNDAGIKTTHDLSPTHPFVLNYIQGVVKIPANFIMVKSVRFNPGVVTFTSITGKTVSTPVNFQFLQNGKLE
jgi:hypothetical protein